MQWEIGDSVKDWLDKWRTKNPSQTFISLESEGKLGVGIATIYRLNQDFGKLVTLQNRCHHLLHQELLNVFLIL